MDTDILDVKAAAESLGVSVSCIYALARKSKIPAMKVGKVWRFHRQSLLNWVSNGSEGAQLESLLKNVKVRQRK